MRRRNSSYLLDWAGVASAASLVLASSVAMAQTGGGYALTWSSIDGGGTLSSGGGYSLQGTIGQPDAGVLSGGEYSLHGGFWGGGGVITGVPGPGAQPGNGLRPPPLVQRLYPSVPNPFNPRTAIAFDLPHPRAVRLEIFNLRGQRVRTLVRGDRAAGHHFVVWEGSDDHGKGVASGSYIVLLSTPDAVHREKIVLVR